MVALVLIAVILLLALFFDAPLLDKANPNFSPNPSKAPWYFMGIQELILHFHPLAGAIIIPLLLLMFIFLIPYFNYDTDNSGIWFYSDKGKFTAKLSAVAASIVTVAGIIFSEYVFDLSGLHGSIPPIISNGLIPIIIILGILFGFNKIIISKYSTDKNESVQALFVFILVSFIILTLTGIIFRGPGMALGF